MRVQTALNMAPVLGTFLSSGDCFPLYFFISNHHRLSLPSQCQIKPYLLTNIATVLMNVLTCLVTTLSFSSGTPAVPLTC